jgi:hypothetical protein
MDQLKLIFLLLLPIFSPINSEKLNATLNPHNSYKFIRCKSFDPKTARVEFCSINQTKTLNTFNVGFTLFKTLNKPIYLQYVVARKTQQNYFQDYFRTELIEICSVFEGASTNPFFKGILDNVGKSAPNLIHPCPFKAGLVDGSNLTVERRKTFTFELPGTYKIELAIYTKNKAPLGLIRTNEVIENSLVKVGKVDLPRTS